MKKATFTFGRMNPPTKGHEQVIDKVVREAKKRGAEAMVFISKRQDAKTNPLGLKEKQEILRSKYGQIIQNDPDALSAFHVMRLLTDRGYKEITLIVGSDRVEEFRISIGRYVVSPDDDRVKEKKFYGLEKFDVVSAGERDPDDDGVTGISGSKMRQFVKDGDFKQFYKFLAGNMPEADAKKIFDRINAAMN